MILYTAIAAITIGLAYFVGNRTTAYSGVCTRAQGVSRICYMAIFLVLFLLSALRLGVGNDYGTYVTTCHEIVKNGYVVTEPGYNLVVKILYTLSGKEDYLLMFAFFGFLTIFIFMKSMYEQSKHFAMSFFLFMTLGMYFRTFSTVRYYFVLAIVMYSLRYVVKKEYGKFILLILLAATFHKSVLVVIPIYFIANRTWKKWQCAALVSIGVLTFALKDYVMKLALFLYPSYKDTIYLSSETGILENVSGILRCVLVLGLCLYFYKKAIETDEANRLYFNLNILALLLYTCGSFLPLLSRFSYYLITPHIFLIPGILFGKNVWAESETKKKKLFIAAVAVIGIIYFAMFLKIAYQDGVRVLPYKTFLFHEQEWLDATQIF